MVASVIRILLPIMTAFVCGMVCRRLHILDASGCQTLKNLVSYIMLPAVLLNAFLFADYTVQSLSVIIVVFVAVTAEFALGFALRKFFPGRGGAMPFLFATMECGSIGYPLIAMLFGQQGTSDMAIIDVGHTVFLFLLVVPVLKITEGESPKLKDVDGKLCIGKIAPADTTEYLCELDIEREGDMFDFDLEYAPADAPQADQDVTVRYELRNGTWAFSGRPSAINRFFTVLMTAQDLVVKYDPD